jgi:hypothetical protein
MLRYKYQREEEMLDDLEEDGRIVFQMGQVIKSLP